MYPPADDVVIDQISKYCEFLENEAVLEKFIALVSSISGEGRGIDDGSDALSNHEKFTIKIHDMEGEYAVRVTFMLCA